MIGSKLAPCLWAKMPLRWIKEIKRTRHGKAWKNLFARLQCNLICLLSDAFHMMLFLAKKLYSNIFKLYIRKSRCLLSLEMSVPWGIIHGNMAVGSLWSRECTASFVGIFVFIDHCTMIYHSLTLGAALPEEKKTPTQLSQTRPCCAEKVFRSAIWKTSSWTAENSFQPRKSPPKSRSSNFCIFSIFSVSTATLRLLTFFPPQVFTFATIFSRRWEPLFIQGACYPALGTCKASKLAVAWKMKTWLSRDPFFEPPPLSNLTSFRHGILPFQLKSQKKKTYEIWYPDWCW